MLKIEAESRFVIPHIVCHPALQGQRERVKKIIKRISSI